MAIRYEDIGVSRRRPALPNGYNVIAATLDHVVPEGASSLLDLQANGITLHALLSSTAMKRLNADRGDRVYALIKKEHVKIVHAG